ncbi:hypothetical protein [Bacillus smithii]|uniref:hypothetical protein n=1 Tax=Bacillus smithii TaxID=1479 RepID=UPI002E1B372B|nr:hypothetical protein [Bacillus smithii]MED4929139.1 hypothetical protein [Bacillus smithii]
MTEKFFKVGNVILMLINAILIFCALGFKLAITTTLLVLTGNVANWLVIKYIRKKENKQQ